MSMLKETIEVKKPKAEVWKYLNLERWPQVTKIFKSVESQQDFIGNGAKFIVTAGPGEEKVKYNVEIITCDEELGSLVYKRTGGPLPGNSEWQLIATSNGTKIVYTNYYQHDLNSTVLSSIVRAMERFMQDLRVAIETGGKQ